MKKLLCILSAVFASVFNFRAQPTNIDFESTAPGAYSAANAVSGWTLSSQINTSSCNTNIVWAAGSSEFSIVSTPVISFAPIGNIPHSPLGGSRIARLNSSVANSSSTKLAQTFSVTSSSSVLQLAYAGVWQGGGHACCDQPSFIIEIKDPQGAVLACNSLSLIPPGPNCQNGATGFSVTSNDSWTNWQVKLLDLSVFTGSAVTIEVITKDCVAGDHYGTLFLDADISPLLLPSKINFCPGSNQASICGPIGYSSYSWTTQNSFPLPPMQTTLNCLTIPGPVANAFYTLNAISNTGCAFSFTYQLLPTQVSIQGVGSHPSCQGGASGSATVNAGGSGTGYTYKWVNASNAIMGTSSTVSGLAPGFYTLTVTAAGSASSACGTATAAVNIATVQTTPILITAPYCNNEAYLNSGMGSNFQWYNGTVAIPSGQGGTASSYTVVSPLNGSTFNVSYTNFFGCKDSTQYALVLTTPGNLSVSNTLACINATNAAALVTLVPASGAIPGNNFFQVSSTGTTAAYSSSLNAAYSPTFIASGLTSGGTYSIQAFDGSCKYTKSFSITPLVFDYTVTASSSVVCSGHNAAGNITFTSVASFPKHTYSWSPSSSLFGSGTPNVIIAPVTVSPGNSVTTIYTVIVTPTNMNCPLTKTLSITTINPITPTLGLIPTLCADAPAYTISANPPGGSFYHPAVSNTGVLNPSLATLGTNTLIYANGSGACNGTTSAVFVVQGPTMTVKNNYYVFCGQTVTLSASGADTYLWSNSLSTHSIAVAPLTSQTYSVKGTSTANMCSVTHTVNVSVTSTFVVSLSGNFPVCSGTPLTLNASGANTYTWNNSISSSSIVVTPQANTVYSVTGTDLFGCQSHTTILVKDVFISPTISVFGNLSVCAGETTTLNVFGAYSYSLNGAPVYFSFPASPGTHTVTGASFEGCTDSKTVTVNGLACVGIQDHIQEIQEIRISPNPSEGLFFIKTNEPVQITIMDCLGKTILKKVCDKGIQAIDLKDYSNGMYILRAGYGDQARIIKLVKNN